MNVADMFNRATGSVYAEVVKKCLFMTPFAGDILELEKQLAGALAQIRA